MPLTATPAVPLTDEQESVLSHISEYLNNESIAHTCLPHEHSLNGVVERAIRSVMEVGQSTLPVTSLPVAALPVPTLPVAAIQPQTMPEPEPEQESVLPHFRVYLDTMEVMQSNQVAQVCPEHPHAHHQAVVAPASPAHEAHNNRL